MRHDIFVYCLMFDCDILNISTGFFRKFLFYVYTCYGIFQHNLNARAFIYTILGDVVDLNGMERQQCISIIICCFIGQGSLHHPMIPNFPLKKHI